MVHFKIKGQFKFLTTNFKVMYSSLSTYPHLKKLHFGQLFILRLGCWILNIKSEHILLVRNPYYRTISFFQDKFQVNPIIDRKDRRYHEWQDCQRLFFQYLGVKKNDSYDSIAKKLISLKFDNFLSFLPKVYLQDPHIRPQSQLNFPICTLNLSPGFFSEIIQLEDEARLKDFGNRFGIDLNLKVNSTSSQKIKNWFNITNAEVIKNLYKNDFEFFNYSMQTDSD